MPAAEDRPRGVPVFIGGPVGVGKSSLGRALSEVLGGGFVEGDDHSDPNRPWYGSVLRTSEALVRHDSELLNTLRKRVGACIFKLKRDGVARKVDGDLFLAALAELGVTSTYKVGT